MKSIFKKILSSFSPKEEKPVEQPKKETIESTGSDLASVYMRKGEDKPEEPNQIPEKSSAVFKVRFRFSGLPLAVNKRLSIFPVPFLIAKSGFQQKIWAVTEDGWFQGIYQWASRNSAQKYQQSFIFKMMTKRSVEGSLSYEVIPDTILSEYIADFVQ